jgi:hypothetical protein
MIAAATSATAQPPAAVQAWLGNDSGAGAAPVAEVQRSVTAVDRQPAVQVQRSVTTVLQQPAVQIQRSVAVQPAPADLTGPVVVARSPVESVPSPPGGDHPEPASNAGGDLDDLLDTMVRDLRHRLRRQGDGRGGANRHL